MNKTTDKAATSGGGSQGRTEDFLARRLLRASAMSRIVTPPRIPTVPAPSTAGVFVKVDIPAPPTDDELADMLREFAFRLAPRQPRAAGELIQLGDELAVDLVAFCDGKLVPFSAHEKATLLLVPGAVALGFAEGLVGKPVGAQLSVPVVLPENFPVASLRQKPAVYAVQVHQAAEVIAPEGQDEALLRQLGIDEDVVAQLCAAAAQERDGALRERITQDVLTQLIDRARVKVPADMIDYAIGQRWLEKEGHFLTQVGVSPPDREEALKAWLDLPELRREVERVLATHLILNAIAVREGIQVTAEEFAAAARDTAGLMGLDRASAAAALENDEVSAVEMIGNLGLRKTLDHVLARVEVRA